MLLFALNAVFFSPDPNRPPILGLGATFPNNLFKQAPKLDDYKMLITFWQDCDKNQFSFNRRPFFFSSAVYCAPTHESRTFDADDVSSLREIKNRQPSSFIKKPATTDGPNQKNKLLSISSDHISSRAHIWSERRVHEAGMDKLENPLAQEH